MSQKEYIGTLILNGTNMYSKVGASFFIVPIQYYEGAKTYAVSTYCLSVVEVFRQSDVYKKIRLLESTLYDIFIVGDLMEAKAETSVAFESLNNWENMYRRNSSWDQKWQAEVEMNQVEAPKLSIFNKSQNPPGNCLKNL